MYATIGSLLRLESFQFSFRGNNLAFDPLDLAGFVHLLSRAGELLAKLSQPLLDQLCEGGLLVMPLGGADAQVLRRLRKVGGRIMSENLGGCRFVPLVSGAD